MQKYKRILFVSAVLFTVLPVLRVQADHGPHGGYTPTTDACAGCHRAHTGTSGRLLPSPVSDLCISCHGSGGNGADTNVLDGVYLERDGTIESPAEGILNRGLKGGGFINASMDTAWVDPGAGIAPVTSAHIWDGALGTAWGQGLIGSGPGGIDFPLSCTACHDPHGGAGTTGGPTYRILRAFPTGSGAVTGIDIDEETTKSYTLSDTTLKSGNQYFGEDYDSTREEQLTNWCSQCHTRYLALANSENTDSGDPIFAYRHFTRGPADCSLCHDPHGGPLPTAGPMFAHRTSCVTCHVAHGTSASMGVLSGAVPWPDGSLAAINNERSALLRVDNRGVCQLCHGK